jgi:Tfp pilus assembly protein PilX
MGDEGLLSSYDDEEMRFVRRWACLRANLPRLRGQEGLALPIALGMTAVLAISLTVVLELAATGQRHANLSDADTVAFEVAEGGLNQAEAVLSKASNPYVATAFPSTCTAATTVSFDGGSACYWGTLDSSVTPPEWTLTSISTVSSPSGGEALTRTAQARFLAGAPMADPWNYVFTDQPGCTYLQNTVVVSAPFYTKGDLCVRNTAAAVGPRVHVYGGIQLENTGRVGTAPSDASDPAVGTRLGCRNGSSGGFNLACADATYSVYRSSFTNSVPDLTKPPFDATKRNTAKPGPMQGCTVSGGVVPSFTSTGLIDLMPSSSYTCQVWQGAYLAGELSWNNATKVLTVAGTIWFDGELKMQNTQHGTYDGRAVIYVAQKATLENQAWLCAVAGCPTSGWDPSTNLLVIVSGAPDIPAFIIQNDAKFQGAVYAVGGFQLQNAATMHGPVIASALDLRNNGLPAGWPEPLTLPSGVPQSSGSSVTLVSGSWRG